MAVSPTDPAIPTPDSSETPPGATLNPSPEAIAFCQALASIHQQGWTQGTGGNFSYLATRHPLLLVMAPSGVDKGRVDPQCLIGVNEHQQVVWGKGKSSAETALHLCIAQRTQARAIFHTHSLFATLVSDHFSSQGYVTLGSYEMLKGLAGITTHDCHVQIPIFANSQDMQELSQKVGAWLETAQPAYGFLLAGHGLYTWGDSIFSAQRHLEILEFLFELTYRKLLIQP
ncbi:methylthioribulose 1-phosphate dehydratase [Lyngbya confervoides]|uniref:Methylthioribulose-1-phosphate dehydratase n=1 Tax=Lyngbya confervoides BDU141951 TaxID=1574623 RepID=A0ABD4T223_9CYAN|nr:methylthioribulose 1-phosphate dehydratase [Lyngbya confervoides]MCM1982704.1 methylthioribulose 1-phosphate dehydratase [Lyngbya confervoides BDU141951]